MTFGSAITGPRGRPSSLRPGRADNKLTSTQARVAVAGSLLRQLHAVITTDTAWDPAIASGLKPQSPASAKEAAAAA